MTNPSLSELRRIAESHGLTAYVDDAAQVVLVFVPHDAGIMDNDEPDDVCEVRTLAELQSALNY